MKQVCFETAVDLERKYLTKFVTSSSIKTPCGKTENLFNFEI